MLNSNFDPNIIRRASQEKRELEEHPSSGFTASGSANTGPSRDLGQGTAKTRMAGPGGAFARRMMEDPEFANDITGWRNMYNQSPPGIEFNAAMMNQEAQKMDVQTQSSEMGAA